MIAGCVLVIGSIFFTRGTGGRDVAELDWSSSTSFL